ncbi:MAG: cob(I)alamin adenosyltransferase [Candidatus Sumerlaeota bacterium]|nr:cob(I)alamin adenosyltransferase [Candidatus Sumerlaeota bacterium]
MTNKHSDRPRDGFRITRVYTGTGDKGDTGLTGGQRVAKDSARIEAYGTVDELGAALGAVRIALDLERDAFPVPAEAEKLSRHVEYLQNQLFTLGGDLATRLEDRHPAMPVIESAQVDYLERLCDHFNEELPPLKDFILAGGSQSAVAFHLARTICRRAERAVARLGREENIGEYPTIYLNRLSDALFVMARWANRKLSADEITWDRDLPEPALGTENS